MFDAMEQFIGLAKKYDLSPMALALEWVSSNPAVSSCVVGARTFEQLEQNLVAWEEHVPSEAIGEVNAIGNRVWDTAPWKPQMHLTS